MRLLALVAAALILPQEKNEAEALFKKMEGKLAGAKSIQLTFTGELNPPGIKLTGAIVLGEANQARCDMEGKRGEEKQSVAVVSDGKRVQMITSGAPKNRPFEVPETLGRLMRMSVARAGCLGTIDPSQREDTAKTDPDTAYVASDFKLGAKEKVGDREAQAVEYKLTHQGEKESAATVWIDAETHLPLKRLIKRGARLLDETYADFKLDEKIDAAKFEIPREAK